MDNSEQALGLGGKQNVKNRHRARVAFSAVVGIGHSSHSQLLSNRDPRLCDIFVRAQPILFAGTNIVQDEGLLSPKHPQLRHPRQPARAMSKDVSTGHPKKLEPAPLSVSSFANAEAIHRNLDVAARVATHTLQARLSDVAPGPVDPITGAFARDPDNTVARDLWREWRVRQSRDSPSPGVLAVCLRHKRHHCGPKRLFVNVLSAHL
mmetsp:Transcript_12959/g.30141  ORF Transcript_12959/g.30141 Transcript_12959/m.30141 type:complete len:207 (-) Transcript_12959:1173-1793(-)